MIPEGCRVLAIFWAREIAEGAFGSALRASETRPRVRTRRCRRPSHRPRRVTSTAARWTRPDPRGCIQPPPTANSPQSQSHRKPELGGARGDDAGNSARDASSEPEDPVERFAVMRALETLRDDDAEPHERTSACERLRDFARATPVLAERRHREIRDSSRRASRSSRGCFTRSRGRRATAHRATTPTFEPPRSGAYIAAAYRQRETDDDDDDDDDAVAKNRTRRRRVGGDGDAGRAGGRRRARVRAGRHRAMRRGGPRDLRRPSARRAATRDCRRPILLDEVPRRAIPPRPVEAVVRAATSATNDDTDEAWAAAMECACRLGPTLRPRGRE